MSTDRRAAKALALSQLREIERIHGSFPFRIELSERILERCRSLVSTIEKPFSGRPADQSVLVPCRDISQSVFISHIYSTLGDAWAAYSELDRTDAISWIEHHELIRKRFCQLLSTTKWRYKMHETQMKEWRYSVFLFAKAFATKLKRKRNMQEDFRRKAQICIDAIHALITLLRDNSEDALFHEDYAFLILLCQRATLLPTSFRCPDHLEIGEDSPINTGASATIYRGFLGSSEVAVKCFRLCYRTVNQVKKRFIREALILQVVRHPNILRFMSVMVEQYKFYVITPWYAHGHIMKYIVDVEGVQLKKLMEQVADGLHFLSQYRIIHGDLKGANVLIDGNGKALIADLGLSFIQDTTVQEESHTVRDPLAHAILRAQCSEAIRSGRLSVSPVSISTLAVTVLSATTSSGGGTFRWMAPERLVPSAYGLPSAKATAKSDVYSFGMLMLEVFSGEPPWGKTRNEANIALSVVSGNRPPRPSGLPDNLWEIVKACWSHLPNERTTIQEIYNRLACIP